MSGLVSELADIRLFLLDLDGTVYLNGKPIGDSVSTIQRILSLGADVCFLTNNSSISGADYVDKLVALGIDASLQRVLTSGMATADYIKSNYPQGRVFLLGTDSLRREFESSGIFLDENNPDICVLGFDKTITYEKIQKFDYFLKKGAVYIATHPDKTCPYPTFYIPDAGSFIAMFYASSGRMPDVVIGKPNEYIGRAAQKRFGVDSAQVALVGDRLYTDMQTAHNCGFRSVLVLSGETTRDMIKKSSVLPDVVLDDINCVFKN